MEDDKIKVEGSMNGIFEQKYVNLKWELNIRESDILRAIKIVQSAFQ